ncbi:MAG: tRNA pseudouridine(55) synthase TruB [Planctomycetia bacterium]|nr:tRNA pseudouridine(55) synthase TruB [Planctomycetia bacterium]
MAGLLNINKPAGMTSRRVVDLVARAARTKRTGHAGTLDPLASGVLVVCVEWATRLVPFIQDRRKSYSAKFLLGRQSDTDDVSGRVVEVTGAVAPTRDAVESALRAFVGEIMQVPPQFSAVHVGGVRAHHAARRGETVDIEPRPVVVHRIELRDYAYPELAIDIECGSGTYVRSIGRDLGNALGCGAVMSALVRTAIGEFTLDTAISLADLESGQIVDHLLPPLTAVAHLPRRTCDPTECTALIHGKTIPADQEIGEAGSDIALVDGSGNLFALAKFDAGLRALQPRQVFGGGNRF